MATRGARPPIEGVAVGQSRRGPTWIVWGVVRAHPTRRGFWLCASHEFSYRIETIGRRELEAMPVVPASYWGSGEHPGIAYWRSFTTARETGGVSRGRA